MPQLDSNSFVLWRMLCWDSIRNCCVIHANFRRYLPPQKKSRLCVSRVQLFQNASSTNKKETLKGRCLLLLNYLLALGRAYKRDTFFKDFLRQTFMIHYYGEIQTREKRKKIFRFQSTQLNFKRRQKKGHLSIDQTEHPLLRSALSTAYQRGQYWPLKWPLGGPLGLPPPPLCGPPRSWKRLDWPPPLSVLWQLPPLSRCHEFFLFFLNHRSPVRCLSTQH